ncbi:MAG: sortase [Clostridia bacterium]|nr:sortase [Clostridia bacterium]
MSESKYGKFLTVLLIIIIIAVLGLIGYFCFETYTNYSNEKSASEFVNSFANDENETTPEETPAITEDPIEEQQQGEENTGLDIQSSGSSSGSSSTKKTKTYQGYTVVGTIQIPKTNVSYPILNENGVKPLQVAVSRLCGADANQPGNMVILGHNYRNGLFFANNKKLSIGDKIYITDLNGQKLTYTIYDKFETEQSNTDWIQRDTNGAREISLQTCTDDGKLRLIILAKCDLDS